MASFTVQTPFKVDAVLFVYFCSCRSHLRRRIQKNIAETDIKKLTAYVFLKEFCGFKSYIYAFNLPYFSLWCKKVIQFSQHHLLKRLSLPYILASFVVD